MLVRGFCKNSRQAAEAPTVLASATLFDLIQARRFSVWRACSDQKFE